MAKKAKNSVLKYTRVKPFTNVLISCLFIFLALICLLPALLAVLSMLLTAFLIAGFSYRRQKKLAERINRELAQKHS